jgi:signal peptidase I
VFAATHAAFFALVVAAEGLPAWLRIPALLLGFVTALLHSADAVCVARGARRQGIARGAFQRAWVLAVVAALGLFAVAPALQWVARQRVSSFRMPHDKMAPTLIEGDLFFARPLAGADVHRGQVVAHESSGTVVLNRVAALAGDTVEMRDGRLRVNGAEVPEPYATPGEARVAPAEMAWQRAFLADPADSAAYAPTTNAWGPVVVPPGTWIGLGDNRDVSLDSRMLGPFPREAVRWAPTWIYFSMDPDGVRWDRLGRGIQPGDG